MRSFYRATVAAFLAESSETVHSRLNVEYANRGFTTLFSEQTLTWIRDLESLRTVLEICISKSNQASHWGLILEFSIPRKESRIDAVLLIDQTIVVLEAKSALPTSQAEHQIEEYALLLHYFHKGSDQHQIIPIMVSPEVGHLDRNSLFQQELFPQLATYWIKPTQRLAWSQLAEVLLMVESPNSEQIDLCTWVESPYFPVPRSSLINTSQG